MQGKDTSALRSTSAGPYLSGSQTARYLCCVAVEPLRAFGTGNMELDANGRLCVLMLLN